jgi:hypothetical protein
MFTAQERSSTVGMARSENSRMADITMKGGKPRHAIPAGVWALGFVSLFMDVSSEMIHALLPVYMVTVLGASALSVGIIEGIAEATAAITKVFSGAISDWFGKRKLLVLAGYGMAALTKPVFPLAPSIDWLVAARFVDRVGKGIRGAPRDALIADITAPDIRGASFGLRQSLDTVGAFLGPAFALVLMWWTADRFDIVFWIAVIPAFVSVGIVLFLVREPPKVAASNTARIPLRRQDLLRLPAAYWLVTAVAAIFHAGAVQRGVSAARCRPARPAGHVGAPRAHRHEPRLCPIRLSDRHPLRPVRPGGAARDRYRPADRRRSRARLPARLSRPCSRRAPLGSAHGLHAGRLRGARC